MKLSKALTSLVLATTSCYASPMPGSLDLTALNSPETELLVRRGIELAKTQDIGKRASADFSLDRSWNNEVLFGDSSHDSQPGSSEDAKVSVTCIECYTKGTVSAEVTDHDLFHPSLKLSFSGVQAYASLGVAASAGQTFSLNLFASESPIGIGITGLDVGVVFFVDLVFSLDEAIDLSAGFVVTVPDDAYVEADILGGDINDSAFNGINSQALPVTVTSGSATFKADLRLRVQAGAEASIDLFGIGAGAVVGIFANIIEFVAVIETTPTCPLETEIFWDLNVGAFAHLDVVVDYTTLGPVPTVSTTLYAGETITSCWIEAGTTTAAEITSATEIPSTTPVPPPATSTPIYSSPAASSPVETDVPSYSSSPSATITSVSIPYSSSVSTAASNSYSSPAGSYSSAPLSSYSVAASYSAPASYPASIPYSSAPLSSYSVAASYSAPVSYPASIPYSSHASYSAAASGPTYTSTYTHTLTRCGAPGVMNCPATYQTEVVVTRTTTVCPATATTASAAPSAYGYLAQSQSGASSLVVVVLSPLPTPIVATFVPPTDVTSVVQAAENTAAATVSVAAVTEEQPSYVAATPAPTSLIVATTPAPLGFYPTVTAGPSGRVNSTVGTGVLPGAPQSTSSPGRQVPVTGGADSLFVLGSVYNVCVGVVSVLVTARAMGIL